MNRSHHLHSLGYCSQSNNMYNEGILALQRELTSWPTRDCCPSSLQWEILQVQSHLVNLFGVQIKNNEKLLGIYTPCLISCHIHWLDCWRCIKYSHELPAAPTDNNTKTDITNCTSKVVTARLHLGASIFILKSKSSQATFHSRIRASTCGTLYSITTIMKQPAVDVKWFVLYNHCYTTYS